MRKGLNASFFVGDLGKILAELLQRHLELPVLGGFCLAPGRVVPGVSESERIRLLIKLGDGIAVAGDDIVPVGGHAQESTTKVLFGGADDQALIF